MSVPAERLSRRPTALVRRQGLVEPLRLSEGITREELARILQSAGGQASDMIQFNMRRSNQLRAAMRGLSGLSTAMWDQIGTEIRAGIEEAADLAATHQLAREIALGMPKRFYEQYAQNLFFNALQSANDVISRRTNGFTLSERILRNGRASVLQLGKIVDQSLALQLSAKEIARKVRGFYNPNVPGGTSYAANRLARTEINNAHHDTTIRLTENRPWVVGYQWYLSGSHPRADICDSYAHEDHDGLGEGVFKKGNVPSNPHPQCLCYIGVVQVSREEFRKNLRDGQYQSFLNRETLPNSTYRSLGGGAGGTFEKPGTVGSRELSRVRQRTQKKIDNAPVPSERAIAQAHEELARAKAGTGRAGGDARGGSAAARRRQRQNLFDEFDGNVNGYVPCHGCGTKMHWADPRDTINNPIGYDRFERGKIFVKCQGGGYQLVNLLPECFACNRTRGASLVRKEIQC